MVKKDKRMYIGIDMGTNSASILEIPDANFNMVRAGITLYGLWPSSEVSKDTIPLYPLMRLVSHVAFVKKLNKGREISYGGVDSLLGNRPLAAQVILRARQVYILSREAFADSITVRV